MICYCKEEKEALDAWRKGLLARGFALIVASGALQFVSVVSLDYAARDTTGFGAGTVTFTLGVVALVAAMVLALAALALFFEYHKTSGTEYTSPWCRVCKDESP